MRARARWGITPLLAAPAGAWALGLGDIELQSALNQPFRAEIALSATADEMLGLRVMLAGPDMFERRGIDRPGFLSNLEFRVVAGRDGRNSIQISSRESITEPFVTLLVEASWPRGRSVKEYTVLLDPPVFLPAPAAPAVRPAETRSSSSSTPSGTITRPAAPPPEPAPAEPAPAEPAPAIREPSVSSTTRSPAPPAARTPAPSGSNYGPVQRAETLWAISERLRPDGVTTNQMMIAIFQANPSAFGGNINLLLAGATLRLPDAADFDSLAATAATAEVRRQIDEWQNRTSAGGQLRLLPPSDSALARAPTPAPAPEPRPGAAPPAAPRDGQATAAGAAGSDRRLLEVQNPGLQTLQEAAAAAETGVEESVAPAAEAGDPGVELESEQLFTDETEPVAQPEQAVAPVPAPAPAPTPSVASQPSLVAQIIDWLVSPLLWIGLGVAALVATALWFMRRRRQETEDVTGRWEALEAETDDDYDSRDATERLRRQVPDETIVVEEQHTDRLRAAPAEEEEPASRVTAAPRSVPPADVRDETLSSQTVINLDQADAIAEADFHIAYGLYDQAAELLQKALEAAPDRRDLKLKLLDVYFMWGNKDAFLKTAQAARADLGTDGGDWSKVAIMGRQICPDESLFSETAGGAGQVDVDLEPGDSPLDLAFDDGASIDVGAASAGLDFDLEVSDARSAPTPRPAAKPAARNFAVDDELDIGERTAAGLEAALFEVDEQDDDSRSTMPAAAAADSLAVTQESPMIEPSSSLWDGEAEEFPASEAPTVESPTIESPGSQARGERTKSKRNESPTVEQPALGFTAGDYTAEISLDDLGLDVTDIEGLPSDLGDLPIAPAGDSDTQEQPALRADDALLSATGVTKVLHGADEDLGDGTSVLEEQEATMLAPGFDDGTGTLSGTEVLDGRHEVDDETGSTSLVRALHGNGLDEGVDLDLEDLSVALHGGETVEQLQSSSFSGDIFGGGDTPLDLNIGSDTEIGDDAPTGTDAGLDPQTMTEIGTKLDLARAYIDMGDPEGARSILEEVLDEGDSSQRREAQGLIDVLSA